MQVAFHTRATPLADEINPGIKKLSFITQRNLTPLKINYFCVYEVYFSMKPSLLEVEYTL